MGTEIVESLSYNTAPFLPLVKLNNPLMGTETPVPSFPCHLDTSVR